MKSEVIQINVGQASKTLAFLALLVSVLIAVSGLVTLAVGAETDIEFSFVISISATGMANKILLLLLMPVFSFVATYVSVAVFCMLYNMVAKYTGGIAFLTKPL